MIFLTTTPKHDGMFDFLRDMIATEDGLVLFLLSLIVIMEIIDFLSGTLAALINPGIEYQSKIGINGLLRKMQGVILLTVLIPMSVLLPDQTGVAFLYAIYVGYLILTFKSLVENYGKAKGDTTIFKNVIVALEKLVKNDPNPIDATRIYTDGPEAKGMKAYLEDGEVTFNQRKEDRDGI